MRGEIPESRPQQVRPCSAAITLRNSAAFCCRLNSFLGWKLLSSTVSQRKPSPPS